MKNIFHIGFHKTATTWYQNVFYKNLKNFNIIKRSNIRDYFYNDIVIDFDSQKSNIFCDEELSGNIHTGGHAGFLNKEIARNISKFDNPKVIIFIRNQYDIIASSYLQYVKKGGTYSLNRYLFHKEFLNSNRTPLFSFDHFNFLNLIDFYVDLIGDKNVYVYLYEDFIYDRDNFLNKFIRDHNFDIDIDKLNFDKSNKSLSFSSLYLTRFFNLFTRKDVLYKYYLFNLPFFYEYSKIISSFLSVGKINLIKFLGKNKRNYINKKYNYSNRELSAKYNLDLKKYNYPL